MSAEKQYFRHPEDLTGVEIINNLEIGPRGLHFHLNEYSAAETVKEIQDHYGVKTMYGNGFMPQLGAVSTARNGKEVHFRIPRAHYYEATVSVPDGEDSQNFNVGFATTEAQLEDFAAVGWRVGSWAVSTEDGAFYDSRSFALLKGLIPSLAEAPLVDGRRQLTVGFGFIYDTPSDASSTGGAEAFGIGGRGSILVDGNIANLHEAYVAGKAPPTSERSWPSLEDLLAGEVRRRVFVTVNGEFRGFVTDLEAHAGGLPVYPAVSFLNNAAPPSDEEDDDDEEEQNKDKKPAESKTTTASTMKVSFVCAQDDKLLFKPHVNFPPFTSRPATQTAQQAAIKKVAALVSAPPRRDDSDACMIKLLQPPEVPALLAQMADLPPADRLLPLVPGPSQWTLRFNPLPHTRWGFVRHIGPAQLTDQRKWFALHEDEVDETQIGFATDSCTPKEFLRTLPSHRRRFPRPSGSDPAPPAVAAPPAPSGDASTDEDEEAPAKRQRTLPPPLQATEEDPSTSDVILHDNLTCSNLLVGTLCAPLWLPSGTPATAFSVRVEEGVCVGKPTHVCLDSGISIPPGAPVAEVDLKERKIELAARYAAQDDEDEGDFDEDGDDDEDGDEDEEDDE